METEKKEYERKGKGVLKKISLTLLVLIEASALMAAGTLIGMTLYLLPCIFPSLSSSDAWNTGVEYAVSWGIWPLVILAGVFFPHDRVCLPHIGRNAEGNRLSFTMTGLLLGFGMNALCTAAALFTGRIDLFFNTFSVLPLLLIFLSVLFQSGAEELICRVFVLRRLENIYSSPVSSIIVNSVFFSLLHIFNDGISITGIVNNLAFGILLSFFVFYYDSFWCAATLHTAWNYSQSIIFGLPNSGVLVPYSVFRAYSTSSFSSFFYDPGFGIEGTVFSCIVLSLAAALVFTRGRRRVRCSAPSEEGR